MKVELPEAIQSTGKHAKEIKLGFTGHIAIPDSWTGGDFEDFHTATQVEDEGQIWDRQWAWVKKRIVEWALIDPKGEKLPTNPNQIKDNEQLTWPLMSFLARSTIQGMNEYMRDGADQVRDLIEFPEPENLTPAEFLDWHEAMNSTQDDDDKSNLLKGWLAGKVLVRGWPEGLEPKSDREADLRLWLAVDDLLAETIMPSLNLGNWSAPLGGM